MRELRTTEPWARDALEGKRHSFPTSALRKPSHPPGSTKQRLSAAVVVRIPGKEKPLGLLGIASSAARTFERDEIDFLANVGNLLGLTVQNVALFESAATARRQWLRYLRFDRRSDSRSFSEWSHSSREPRARLASWPRARSGPGPPAARGAAAGEIRLERAAPTARAPPASRSRSIPRFGGYFLATDSAFPRFRRRASRHHSRPEGFHRAAARPKTSSAAFSKRSRKASSSRRPTGSSSISTMPSCAFSVTKITRNLLQIDIPARDLRRSRRPRAPEASAARIRRSRRLRIPIPPPRR